MPQIREVARAKEVYSGSILAKPNVVGVGIGYRERGGRLTDELCVVALVDHKIPRAGLEPHALVPQDLDGIPTDVLEVGVLRALQARTDRWRPAPGGVSVGHYKITAGTLGCVVRERVNADRLILSNNHVLANSNTASLGDPILQPGTYDVGREGVDTIAVLTAFHPIQFNVEPASCSLARWTARAANMAAQIVGSKHRLRAYRYDASAVNRVDAALARPLSDDLVVDEILEVGVVGGVAQAALGMPVRKSGRATGLTSGKIRVLEATVDVEYGERKARFEGQIVTGGMSAPGDSGSLLVTGEGLHAVGLLFAGSDQSTIYNPIQAVLDALAVTL